MFVCSGFYVSKTERWKKGDQPASAVVAFDICCNRSNFVSCMSEYAFNFNLASYQQILGFSLRIRDSFLHTIKRRENNERDGPKTFAFGAYHIKYLMKKEVIFHLFNVNIICLWCHCWCNEIKLNSRWLKARCICLHSIHMEMCVWGSIFLFFPFFSITISYFFSTFHFFLSFDSILYTQVISVLIVTRVRVHSHACNKRNHKIPSILNEIYRFFLAQEKMESFEYNDLYYIVNCTQQFFLMIRFLSTTEQVKTTVR